MADNSPPTISCHNPNTIINTRASTLVTVNTFITIAVALTLIKLIRVTATRGMVTYSMIIMVT